MAKPKQTDPYLSFRRYGAEKTPALIASLISFCLLSTAQAAQLQKKLQKMPPIAPSATAANGPSNRHIVVRSVRWEGVSTEAAQTQLLKAQAAWLGKSLDGPQLTHALADLSAQLREAGLMVAQAIVRDADQAHFFATGELNISVFEGKVGAVEIQNTSNVDDERLRRTAEQALCPTGLGDACVLTAKNVERTTQLLQDITGVQLEKPKLSSEGVALGQTKVTLSIGPSGGHLTGAVGIDNNGIGVIGKNRLFLSAAINNALRLGEVFDLSFYTTNRHQNSGRFGFKVPVAANGLLGTASIARSLFSVPAVNSDGSANTAALGLAYPMQRGLDRNWLLALDGIAATSKIETLGVQVSQKELYSIRLSLGGNSGDRPLQLDQSYWSGSFALLAGRVKDKESTADPANQLGHYQKLSYQLLRKQNLTETGSWYALGNLRGQLASRNLDPFEKLPLGGMSGVRAYRNDEGTLDDGAIATIELRRRFHIGEKNVIAPGLFIDYATGFINHTPYPDWQLQNGYSDSQLSNRRSLTAYGVAFDWINQWGISTSLIWAKKTPGSADSVNYPGSANSRIWFSLGYRF